MLLLHFLININLLLIRVSICSLYHILVIDVDIKHK